MTFSALSNDRIVIEYHQETKSNQKPPINDNEDETLNGVFNYHWPYNRKADGLAFPIYFVSVILEWH